MKNNSRRTNLRGKADKDIFDRYFEKIRIDVKRTGVLNFNKKFKFFFFHVGGDEPMYYIGEIQNFNKRLFLFYDLEHSSSERDIKTLGLFNIHGKRGEIDSIYINHFDALRFSYHKSKNELTKDFKRFFYDYLIFI